MKLLKNLLILGMILLVLFGGMLIGSIASEMLLQSDTEFAE